MPIRMVNLKIWYDANLESEDSIVEEIEAWEGTQEVKVLGNYTATEEGSAAEGGWPEDEEG